MQINDICTKRVIVICGVLFLSAVSALWMLPEKSLDSHECFVSVTAREMLQNRDWIVPTCNGTARLNKTPLSYWLVAGLSRLTGTVDEFTARFPSAVFAFLSAAAVLYFVGRLISLRTAAVCTCVWITTLGYIGWSHNARPDMALTFFVTLCLLSFYSATVSGSRKEQIILMLVFWISLGLGMLAKGPAPLPYVLLPALFHFLYTRQWKLITRLLPVAGCIIFAAIMLPWPLLIADKFNWDLTVWRHEYIDRLTGDYARGDYLIYFYFLMMFKYITPWFAFLPMALSAPFFRIWGKKRPLMVFMWLWFVVGMVFLTVDAGKRQHYILPLMPAMAILTGIVLEDLAFIRCAYGIKFAGNVLVYHLAGVLVCSIGAMAYMILKKPVYLRGTVSLSILSALLLTAVTLLFIRKRPTAACAIGFAGLLLWVIVSKAFFLEYADDDRPSRDFAKTIRQIVPPSERLVAFKRLSSRFVQYFGETVPILSDISEAEEKYQQGNWVLCNSEDIGEFDAQKSMRAIYHAQAEEGQNKSDVGGTLFHKTVPPVSLGATTRGR